MRKFVLMALAACGIALASPLAATAAPVVQGEALAVAVDSMNPVVDAAWHCRRWSGWCRGGWRVYRGWHRPVWRHRYYHRGWGHRHRGWGHRHWRRW